jgi:pSer/pThr/pTyr-binding forkhead associated (FHA) protein
MTLSTSTKTFAFSGEDKNKILIGRSLRCEFSIPLHDLSREHCLIELENDILFITDLDSSNGVWVDGKRINPHTKTLINERTSILLSSLYVLELNPLEMKTRSGYVIRTIDSAVDTKTFELDLSQDKKKNKKRHTLKLIEKMNQGSPKENLKMLLGFLAAMAFIIYTLNN